MHALLLLAERLAFPPLIAALLSLAILLGHGASAQPSESPPVTLPAGGMPTKPTKRELQPLDPPAGNIIIRFKGGLVGDNIADVLAYLGEQQFIRLYPFVARPETNPSEIITSLTNLPLDLITAKLSRQLCVWNRHVCDFSKSVAGTWRNDVATSEQYQELLRARPTGDVESTCPSGKHLPTYVLCLPHVTFTDSPSGLVLDVPSSRAIEPIVVKSLRGCTNFDESCRKYISLANPSSDPFSPSFSGKVYLPTRLVSMTVAMKDEVSLDLISTVLRGRYEKDPSITFTIPTKQGQPQAPAAAAERPSANLSELPYNRHYLERMAYGEAVRKKALHFEDSGRSVLVGIFDKYADPAHRVYRSPPDGVLRYSVDVGAHVMLDYQREPLERYPLHEKLQELEKKYVALAFPNVNSELQYDDEVDHATFIAGVIGSKSRRSPASAGVNPAAKFWVYHTWRLETKDRYDPEITSYLLSKLSRLPAIVNISQAYTDNRRNTALEQAIRPESGGVARTAIVVAAAGNRYDPMDLAKGFKSKDCFALPACWSITSNETTGLPAVVSVVALDPSGKETLKCRHISELADSLANRFPGCNEERFADPVTQWGPLFDVSAIGVANGPMILNRYSALAGTSVAAAYVSGLASLIFMEGEPLQGYMRGIDIANRIRATADYDGGTSRYGRINFEHALQLTRDVLYLRDGTPLNGEVRQRHDAAFSFRDNANQRVLPVRLPEIVRLHRTNGDNWRVILREGKKLKVIDSASIDGAKPDIAIDVDGEIRTVQLDVLKDFISCSVLCR